VIRKEENIVIGCEPPFFHHLPTTIPKTFNNAKQQKK